MHLAAVNYDAEPRDPAAQSTVVTNVFATASETSGTHDVTASISNGAITAFGGESGRGDR